MFNNPTDVTRLSTSPRAGRARRPGARLALAATTALLALPAAAHAQPVAEPYIVTVKGGHDPAAVAASVAASPRHVYKAALNGFAAKLNDGQLNALRHNPKIELVEEDSTTSASTTQSMDASGHPWGLDRIDQSWQPLSGTYTYGATGANVRAYIFDTGLQTNHSEFEGRALNMYNATSGSGGDCNGHGTHVAGTVGGKTYGVAKRVLLLGVKVLGADCTRLGFESDLIKGIEWLIVNAVKPAVANMSLTTPTSPSVNNAVRALVASGVFVAAAAGNQSSNACRRSPASEPSVFTTAASTSADSKAGFSNWGSCVDAYAPGEDIRSARLNGSWVDMDGTSMAAPHVAGTAALLCSGGYCPPAVVTDWIKDWGTPGAITSNPSGTPNLLLNKHAL